MHPFPPEDYTMSVYCDSQKYNNLYACPLLSVDHVDSWVLLDLNINPRATNAEWLCHSLLCLWQLSIWRSDIYNAKLHNIVLGNKNVVNILMDKQFDSKQFNN